MLGDRRTAPLWRHRKTQPLALERALAPGRNGGEAEQTSAAEQAVVGFKAQQRMALAAKQKAKLGEH